MSCPSLAFYPVHLKLLTTLDISIVRPDILRIADLGSPYMEIAADVNGTQSVTTLDIERIRRLILEITSSYDGGPIWQFVPSDYGFGNPSVPWPFVAERAYSNLADDRAAQDFIGIRMGDANGSWTAP